MIQALNPVRDMDGHILWRVRMIPNERTCLECGEVFPEGRHCVNCCLNEDGSRRRDPPPSVPTHTYLRDGEFEVSQ